VAPLEDDHLEVGIVPFRLARCRHPGSVATNDNEGCHVSMLTMGWYKPVAAVWFGR
jgi:hypothetical protein